MKYEPVYQDYFYPKKARKLKGSGDRVRFEMTFDSVVDKDVINKLNQQPNKADYIRELIRKDIKKRGR